MYKRCLIILIIFIFLFSGCNKSNLIDIDEKINNNLKVESFSDEFLDLVKKTKSLNYDKKLSDIITMLSIHEEISEEYTNKFYDSDIFKIFYTNKSEEDSLRCFLYDFFRTYIDNIGNKKLLNIKPVFIEDDLESKQGMNYLLFNNYYNIVMSLGYNLKQLNIYNINFDIHNNTAKTTFTLEYILNKKYCKDDEYEYYFKEQSYSDNYYIELQKIDDLWKIKKLIAYDDMYSKYVSLLLDFKYKSEDIGYDEIKDMVNKLGKDKISSMVLN